jgi:hypothetical protein
MPEPKIYPNGFKECPHKIDDRVVLRGTVKQITPTGVNILTDCGKNRWFYDEMLEPEEDYLYTRKYHYCRNNKIRCYPTLVCSMCRLDEGTEFHPNDEIKRLQKENEQLRAANETLMQLAIKTINNIPIGVELKKVVREYEYPCCECGMKPSVELDIYCEDCLRQFREAKHGS